MRKLNIGHLDTLFTCLDGKNNVLWARCKEYNKQLYISPSYEDIWGIPCDVLYEDPTTFMESINQDEFSQNIFTAVQERKNIPNEKKLKKHCSHKVFFRIKTPEGKIKFVYDTPMILTDSNNNTLGFCGIAGELSQEDWHEQYYENRFKSSHENTIELKIISALQQEAGLLVAPQTNEEKIQHINFFNTGTEFTLSKRESDILKHLMLGFSAKQIARALTLSPRTVETHLSNIKSKYKCRTITELLSQIITNNRSQA